MEGDESLSGMVYEPLFELEKTGIEIKYLTNKGRYSPPHWHAGVEMIYILNGIGRIVISGREYKMVAGEFIVIDSNQVHETKCAKASMMIMIHFSRNSMKTYVPELDSYSFRCSRITLKKEEVPDYLEICSLLKRLPPLYVTRPRGYRLLSQAITMEILFQLLNHFAVPRETMDITGDEEGLKRLADITAYIEEHHSSKISLEEIAEHFYLSREYFSRFFKQNMGVTFSRYVNQIRLMHIYHDLSNTSDGVMELVEKHGFTNYKLFNKMFQEIYGCKPSQVRQKD